MIISPSAYIVAHIATYIVAHTQTIWAHNPLSAYNPLIKSTSGITT